GLDRRRVGADEYARVAFRVEADDFHRLAVADVVRLGPREQLGSNGLALRQVDVDVPLDLAGSALEAERKRFRGVDPRSGCACFHEFLEVDVADNVLGHRLVTPAGLAAPYRERGTMVEAAIDGAGAAPYLRDERPALDYCELAVQGGEGTQAVAVAVRHLRGGDPGFGLAGREDVFLGAGVFDQAVADRRSGGAVLHGAGGACDFVVFC